jgi:hypothetical protein
MSAETLAADLGKGISALHAEAGGIFRVVLIHPDAGERLIIAAALGDTHSLELLRVISDCAVRIGNAPKHTPQLCLCCPRPIRTLKGIAFAIAMPSVERPRLVLGSAVCPRCAGAPDLVERVTTGLRQVWPDLRQIQITAAPETVQ